MGMPLEPKTRENANCLHEFFHKRKGVQNVHHLHGHMPGDAFSTGQLQCLQEYVCANGFKFPKVIQQHT